jgi:hypothetical protein
MSEGRLATYMLDTNANGVVLPHPCGKGIYKSPLVDGTLFVLFLFTMILQPATHGSIFMVQKTNLFVPTRLPHKSSLSSINTSNRGTFVIL